MKMSIVLLWVCCLAALETHVSSAAVIPNKYESIFSFGDSLSDTGNAIAFGVPLAAPAKLPPYGETFFKHPTGRWSDGRLIIDFLAEEFGLPLLPPYLEVTKNDSEWDAKSGVNFAVSGATAVDPQVLIDAVNTTFASILINSSLGMQGSWFQQLRPSICSTGEECRRYFKKSLFVVGEIGQNDYSIPLFFAGRSIDKVRDIVVPLVISAIANATRIMIEEGAENLLVPGNLPLGCLAIFLTSVPSSNQSDYDPRTGCLKPCNSLSEYHNEMLKMALESLRAKYPHARIMYGDLYGASMQFFREPKRYGFYGGTLRACCGGGGPLNFSNMKRCGQPGSKVCDDPSAFVGWDGIHLTEAAYRVLAKELIYGPFTYPPLL